ncbi:hypothetical protein [Streptomyces sp. NPDC046985]
MRAKQVLKAEGLVIGGLVLALLVSEIPGLMREIKILRMVGLRNAARHRR